MMTDKQIAKIDTYTDLKVTMYSSHQWHLRIVARNQHEEYRTIDTNDPASVLELYAFNLERRLKQCKEQARLIRKHGITCIRAAVILVELVPSQTTKLHREIAATFGFYPREE